MVDALIRVVLAGDHAVARSGLRGLLTRDGMEIVAEAGDAEAALRDVRAHRPDVLVLDLGLPGEPGPPVIPRFLEASPDTRIVVLATASRAHVAGEALTAGATASVPGEAPGDELVRAVHAACEGRADVPRPRLRRPSPPGGLSAREAGILGLIALGYTNAEIAGRLYLSVRTVETHRAHIQQKLGRTTRAELVRFALDNGLVEMGDPASPHDASSP